MMRHILGKFVTFETVTMRDISGWNKKGSFSTLPMDVEVLVILVKREIEHNDINHTGFTTITPKYYTLNVGDGRTNEHQLCA